MDKTQYENLRRNLHTFTQSTPVKVVLLIGSALVTLMVVGGIFRVLSVFFHNYNSMKKAYQGK